MFKKKKNIFDVELHKSKFFDWVMSALIFSFLLLMVRIKSSFVGKGRRYELHEKEYCVW